jgi:hypothetical protein
VNVASEKTREIVMQCSELYGNIERMAEKIIPPVYTGHKSNRIGGDDPRTKTYAAQGSINLL